MRKSDSLPSVIASCVAIVPELGPVFADILSVCADVGYVAPELREAWWRERWLLSQGIVFGAMKALVLVGHVPESTDDKVKRIWNGQGGS